MTDPILVLAWLVLAHLVADFVLQSGPRSRGQVGSRLAGRSSGSLAHGLVVALASSRSGWRSATAAGGSSWSPR